MEPITFNKKPKKMRHEIFSDPYKLVGLVHKMQLALDKGFYIDFNSTQRFSYNNKKRSNPFGYDLKKGKKLKNQKCFYKNNRLCHKLIRIRKELKFVKNNLKLYQKLTLREKEIIQLLANGRNNPQIADQLFISRYTVQEHRKNINHKLEIHSLPFLLKYAYAFDLV